MSGTVGVLLVTDIPFWRRGTGAEQRIAALARNFGSTPFELSVFFLGALPSPDHSIATPATTFVRFDPARPWWRHAFLRRSPAAAATTTSNVATARVAPLTLADYHWPHAIPQFRRVVHRVKPRSILFEYVTTAYLARQLREQPIRGISPPLLCLDSHDLLHRRCQQFTAAGHSHWLAISEQEERDAIQPFDLILAIQPDEAAWFRANHRHAKVLVVGHAVDFGEVQADSRECGQSPRQDAYATGDSESQDHRQDATGASEGHRQDAYATVLGYFGSNNASNADAVLRFASAAWPEISRRCPRAEWLIAGTIVDHPDVARLGALSNIRCRRDVPSLSEYYRQIDVAINPVRFGTGLKIKNVEALAFGRPVVTTALGRVGISEAFGESCWGGNARPGEPCYELGEMQAMARWIIYLVEHPAVRVALSRQAEQVARRELSAPVVFGELSNLMQGKP